MDDEALRRLNMVESQLRTNKVTDPRVIGVMGQLSRAGFLPARLARIAYVDEDIPLGGGRFLMEPMVFARLAQAANIREGDVALEIGTGCGYGTAVLAKLASTVVSVEDRPDAAAQAGAALARAGVDNAVVVTGPLEAGYPSQAPYDVIMIAGAIAESPETILGQLAEGGRMVAVLRAGEGPGRATLWRRRGGIVGARALFDAYTPHLPGFAPATGFAFA
jgi:protein-L-isoaspartate(D-aspartate) O-methyltransferase